MRHQKRGVSKSVYLFRSYSDDTMVSDSRFDRFTTDPAAVDLIDRNDAQNVVATLGTASGWRHAYLYGPPGSGKTHLARTALATYADTVATCYIPCLIYNTQYKVLNRLATLLTDQRFNSGYHTAQLQQVIRDRLPEKTVIVLDDLGFLLMNDGDDLLYFLSRMEQTTLLHLIGISANYPRLEPLIDDRTYSSLRPRQLSFDPYTKQQVSDILDRRAQDAFANTVIEEAAITAIAAATSNIRLGLQWLAQAAETTDSPVTSDRVEEVREKAVQRYRETALTDFTVHHHVLLEAVTHLTRNGMKATTGTVYSQYQAHCETAQISPLTARHISDFLTHLELLHLIEVDHYKGGKHGKTRKIQLTPLQQL